jgi:hypothetical protein
MWGMIYTNRRCNEYEKFYQHKSHLERIVNTKPAIKISEPKKPAFLFKSNRQIHLANEKNIKIDYENGLLMKKIIEVETHDSNYHPHKLKIKDCPAFDKTQSNDYSKKVVLKDNFVKLSFIN